MTTQTLTTPDHTFRIEQDYTEVRTAGPEADKDWRATDSNGHEHYWSPESDHYPTLEWVVTGSWWCEEHQEEHDEGEYRCRLCGNHVQPGMLHPGPRVRTIPTMRHYFIDEREVDEAEFNEAVEKAKAEGT